MLTSTAIASQARHQRRARAATISLIMPTASVLAARCGPLCALPSLLAPCVAPSSLLTRSSVQAAPRPCARWPAPPAGPGQQHSGRGRGGGRQGDKAGQLIPPGELGDV